MLTIREPIKLVNKNIGLKSDAGLSERIRGNYSMLGSNIEASDLLHMVTNPPELLYVEGDNTSIFNNKKTIVNIMEEKLTLVNQLLNRISVSPSVNMTYQDKVTISTILRKLGIKNENLFLERVNNTLSSLEQTNYQINELEEKIARIIQNKGEDIIPERVAVTGAAAESEGEVLKLHSNIYERLDTKHIYDMVYLLSTGTTNTKELINKQLIMSEQLVTSDLLKLNTLEKRVLHREVPLVYNNDSLYEEEYLSSEENLTEETINSNLNSAVLIKLIEAVYENKIKNNISSNTQFYEISSNLYETANNTLNRIEQNIEAPMVINQINEGDRVYEQANQVLNYLENNEYFEDETTINNEEQILENLRQIEENNIQNYNNYMKALEELDRRASGVVKRNNKSRLEKNKEALLALNNPEELLHRYAQSSEENREIEAQNREELLRALPPQNRRYFEIIDRVLNNPSGADMELLQPADPQAVLMQDIENVNRAVREQVPQTPSEREVSKTVREDVKRVLKKYEQTEETIQNIVQNNRELSFVHKENSTVNEDEIVELLLEQRELISQKKVETIETSEIEEIVKKQIKETRTVTETVNNEQVRSIVAQNVVDQVEQLSDQVYNRLERRLLDEKRRRGY